MTLAKNPGANAGKRICRYEVDTWWDLDDGRAYVKVTGIQYERATYETFHLTARRKIRQMLEEAGLDRSLAIGNGSVEEWDVFRNLADGLPEAYVFRTAIPVLQDDVA